MRKNSGILAILSVLVMLLAVSPVSAVGPYPVNSDIWVSTAGTQYTANPLQLKGDDTGGGCISSTAYLQWTGLTAVADEIAVASIGLTSSSAAMSKIPTPGTLTVYGTSDDALPPLSVDTGTVLSSKSFPAGNLAAGTPIVFPSSAHLVSYLNTARTGDGKATFAILWTTCSAHLQGITDSSTATPPLLTLEDSNAVTLSSLAADDPAPSWPLYAGLGAVALIVVAGLAISRRRTA